MPVCEARGRAGKEKDRLRVRNCSGLSAFTVVADSGATVGCDPDRISATHLSSLSLVMATVRIAALWWGFTVCPARKGQPWNVSVRYLIKLEMSIKIWKCDLEGAVDGVPVK